MDGCQVVARIGKQVVLSCELLWKVNLTIERNGGTIPPDKLEEVRYHLLQQELKQALDMKLLYADFRSKVPDASLPDIYSNLTEPFDKDRIPRLLKELRVKKRSEIGPRLKELGSSLEDVRQDYYQMMIARSWVQEVIKTDKEVTHQQLLDYYRENAAKYDYPAQARWEELMVRFDKFRDRDAAWAAIAGLGNSAYATAATQPDASTPAFAQIAKTESQGFTAKQGGEHDWTTKGSLSAKRVDEALFALPLGQMSPILQSNQGFHIVRVLERKTAGRKPFTEVQAGIENRIRGRRYDAALKVKLDEMRLKTQIWTVFSGTSTAQAYLDSPQTGPVRR